MDDPKETNQGELQPKAGLTSVGDAEGTSKDTTPENLTREQAQKMVSDALAEQGRKLKAAKLEAEQYKTAHSKLEGELNQTREQMAAIQRRIDEAEEEEAKGSPESLKLYQSKKRLQEMEARLRDEKRQMEKDKLEHAEELRAAQESKVEMAIISAAIEAHVDIEKLKGKVKMYGLTTREQIDDMAQTLASGAGVSGDNGKKIIPKGDSGVTIGGGSGLGELPPKERLKAIDKMLREK